MYKDGSQLKEKDREALEDLKERLADIVDYDRRKLGSDFFLFQWLRSLNMNVEKTALIIRNAFIWRKENGVTNDFLDISEDLLNQFPIGSGGRTKKGMPFFTLIVKDWNVKEAIDEGDEEKMRRYVFLRSLEAESAWLDFNESQLEEQGVHVMYNPTNIHFVINAKNLPIEQYMYPKVMESFIGTFLTMSKYFNGKGTELFFINFTTVYCVLFNMVKPFLTFTAQMHIFNGNQGKWKKSLFDFIDPDQLSPKFGGTKSIPALI